MRSNQGLAQARRAFAEKIRALAAVRSPLLVEALATVRREDFLGLGPWQILRPVELGLGYEWTPDDDPRHLCDNVLIAIDASRNLNNGEPVGLLRWLDCLALAPGERLLHIGCGVGYYTAIAAAAVPDGSVLGIELDPRLAERARRNLALTPNATVLPGDGSTLAAGTFDAIFVNAGATEPLPAWLDALAPGGRLLVPMTVAVPREGFGGGHMLLVTKRADGLAARFVSTVGVFDCAGARSDEGERLLRAAYTRGGPERVRSLRSADHTASPHCWLHAPRFCLSELEVGATPV
jgi:protein-L-isoaspartate(D-aspartate) O-methyltransferase